MARGVQEGDGAAVDFDGIGADVLGDAAGLAGDDVGMADIVQQGGLAVVDVAHDHHDRGTRLKILFLVRGGVDQALLHRDDDFLLDFTAEFHRHQRRGVIIHRVGDRGEHAGLDKLLDDLGRRLLHAGGQFAHRDLVGNLDHQGLFLRDLTLQTVLAVALFLSALGRGLLLCLLALLGLGLDLLLVAAATAAHLLGVGLVAGHVLELLVVLLDVDRRAAAGIDHTLLGHLARDVRLVLLFLLRLGVRLGLRGRGALLLCGGLLPVLAGRLRSGAALGFRRAGSGRLLRFGFFLRLGLLLGRGDLEHILQAGHLVVLGHVLKDDIQLRCLENLHMVLGCRRIIRQDLRDHL